MALIWTLLGASWSLQASVLAVLRSLSLFFGLFRHPLGAFGPQVRRRSPPRIHKRIPRVREQEKPPIFVSPVVCNSGTPPLFPPGRQAEPRKSTRTIFGLQHRIPEFHSILKACCLPKCCQMPTQITPNFNNNALLLQMCFHTVFSLIWEGFFVA